MTDPRDDPAWQALQQRLLSVTPACTGDDRFIADAPPRLVLEPICRACPARVECRAFAVATKPAAGFWAGMTTQQIKQAHQRIKAA